MHTNPAAPVQSVEAPAACTGPTPDAVLAEREAYQERIREEIARERVRNYQEPPPSDTPLPPPPPLPMPTRAEQLAQLAQALADPTPLSDDAFLAPTPMQVRAIGLLVQGASDNEVARRLDIHRTTVNRWRHFDPIFIARLNRARNAVWANTLDGLRALLPDSVSVLAEAVRTPNHPARTRAAIQVLKVAGASRLAPRTGPTTTHDVLFDLALREQRTEGAPHYARFRSPPQSADLDAQLQAAALLIRDPSERDPDPDPSTPAVLPQTPAPVPSASPLQPSSTARI